MQSRDAYPPGVPCWIDLEVPDPDAVAEHYGGLFGWSFEDRAPEGAPFRYLVAKIDGLDVAAISSPSGDGRPGPAWTTWVAVESADEAAARVRTAGGTLRTDPTDLPGAGRSALCEDPSGAVFGLWEAHGTPGARLVNSPGTWNWSDLRTKDPEAAARFYGAVFGWEARAVDLGGTTATMWCRPGYGDWLAERDPDLRRRHAESGVPPGFSDAIGWLEESAVAEPHWHVTFAADDTDGVAERAASLGGAVLSPPFDAGPTRVTVLQDPQGASFTVSHYRG